MNSALYRGTVRHRRHGDPSDELRYHLFMAYLDLQELPSLMDGLPLWSARRPAPAWFRRSDHLGDPAQPLLAEVRALVRERTGIEQTGPVRLLTNLRYFGVGFNPVSFYYCFAAEGGPLTAVIADVTNTPWGERHAYVMPVGASADHGSTRVVSGSFAKALHVSPLMGMEHTYQWRLTEPGEQLAVHITSTRAGDGAAPFFDATLALRRRPLTPSSGVGALVRYPLLTARILTRIYAHALSLRLRGAKYFPHPTAEVLAR